MKLLAAAICLLCCAMCLGTWLHDRKHHSAGGIELVWDGGGTLCTRVSDCPDLINLIKKELAPLRWENDYKWIICTGDSRARYGYKCEKDSVEHQ